MTNEEYGRFMKQMIGAYPQMNLMDATMEIWQRHLSGMEYDQAIRNLDRHVCTSKFPPTIAEIMNPEIANRRSDETGREWETYVPDGKKVVWDA